MKRLWLISLAWVASKSPCFARKVGLVGPMAATVLDGKYKGLPLGLALRLQEIDGA